MASPQRVAILKATGRAFPSPVDARALIDTGASCTAVDDSVIRMLELKPTGQVTVHTPTSPPSGEARYLYDVSIMIGNNQASAQSHTISVIATSLESQGFLILIGWDILSRCVLKCDGPNNMFELNW